MSCSPFYSRPLLSVAQNLEDQRFDQRALQRKCSGALAREGSVGREFWRLAVVYALKCDCIGDRGTLNDDGSAPCIFPRVASLNVLRRYLGRNGKSC
jgi:hypothetical protein